MKIPYSLFLFIAIITFALSSCSEDPKVITETITVRDTIYVTNLDTITNLIQDTATTFFLLKHAETTGVGSNPSLNTAGQERANELVRIMKSISLDVVYSTNYNRTIQTATPTASDQNLSIQQYNPFDLDPFIDEALINFPKGKVLVLGHSNITPFTLNLLTDSNDYPELPDDEFDNLFIVSVYEKGKADVLHLKYGN